MPHPPPGVYFAGVMTMPRTILVLAALLVACGEPTTSGDGGPDLGLFSIDPTEVELVSVDGSMPSVTLRGLARTIDGEQVEVAPAAWRLSHDRLGVLDAGTFTASGEAGGEVEVIATAPEHLGGGEVSAIIRVRVEITVPPGPEVPADRVADFDALPSRDDPFASASLLYPLEGARMPNNIAPPEVQWYPRENEGDVFRIELATEYTTVRGFTHDSGRNFRSSWKVPSAAWGIIADSARGAEVSVRVDRLPAGADEIVPGTPVDIWLSGDGVFGTLYYWQVGADPQTSDVLRIDAATGERESVFATGTGTCVGCHALSHDGRRLAATTDARGLSWVTEVVDTTSAEVPPPDIFAPLSPAYHFLAFRPDDRRVLGSRAEGGENSGQSRLELLDGITGERIEGAVGLPEGNAGYPAWSPDGAWIAWMDGGSDGTHGTAEPTRIAIAEVVGDDAFGEAVVLHDGASLEDTLEGGRTDSRPTWSPDSRFVAFAHGTRSISTIESGAPPPRAALYLALREGGEPLRLARGMGREGPVDAFWPVFSPFVTEEADGTRLFWLAFYSRQHYGNTPAGTRGTQRRQLWVMAIDPARAEAGEDPSYPPYWLPGQDSSVDNIAAIWAPTACRGRDERCGASSECCSGECAPDPDMPEQLTCQPPTMCRETGASCSEASDCCGSLECNLNICGYAPPI